MKAPLIQELDAALELIQKASTRTNHVPLLLSLSNAARCIQDGITIYKHTPSKEVFPEQPSGK